MRQFIGLSGRVGGAEDEDYFLLLIGLEGELELEAGDAVAPFTLAVPAGAGLHCVGRSQIAETADKALLVALIACDRYGGGEKGGPGPDDVPVAALIVGHLPEALAGEEDLLLRVEGSLDEGLVKFAMVVRREAEVPLEVAEEVEFARPAAAVGEVEDPDFGRLICRRKEAPVAGDPLVEGGEHRIAEAVPDGVLAIPFFDRLESGRPDLTRGAVAEVDELAPVVAHEVLVPAGEAVKVGVRPPAETPSGLGDDQAIVAVGDDIDPGLGGVGACDDVLQAVITEMAVGGGEFHCGCCS